MSLSGGCSESVMMQGMVIDMEEARLQTIAQVRAFLAGATEITCRVPKVERYPFTVSFRIDVACASANKVTVRPAH